jgi:carbon-monoxide dehydrogenase large subunit
MPRFELIHQHSPSPLNPFGVKGVGEGGPIAPPAVIANGVADALREFNVEFDETPIAPHHIEAAIRAALRGR